MTFALPLVFGPANLHTVFSRAHASWRQEAVRAIDGGLLLAVWVFVCASDSVAGLAFRGLLGSPAEPDFNGETVGGRARTTWPRAVLCPAMADQTTDS